MTRARILAALLASLLVGNASAQSKAPQGPTYGKRPEVRAYIKEMVRRHGFVEKELVYLFSRTHRIDPILQAIAQPAEKVKSWKEYRELLVSEKRMAGGREFWAANRAALERAEREFGVPAEYIVAIIGVETLYGRNTGRYRVIDSLSTLAFDYPPRAEFFRDELTSYLLLARDEGINVFATKGSYAGAIGIPQFMPGSARRYAVDFDGSGAIDLHKSAVDAVGSVANFLKRHGWRTGDAVLLGAKVTGNEYAAYATGSLEPKATLATLSSAGVQPQAPLPQAMAEQKAALIELATPGEPSDFRLGLHNFWVLTRYNRSALYAAAVSDLAAALRAERAGQPASPAPAAQEPGK
ncbi:MAG TPA: lytic murein transglycosylase B [Myxococcota bacterium]|nr:lytic murein transglycosylase B [Myxococcota bacterium]